MYEWLTVTALNLRKSTQNRIEPSFRGANTNGLVALVMAYSMISSRNIRSMLLAATFLAVGSSSDGSQGTDRASSEASSAQRLDVAIRPRWSTHMTPNCSNIFENLGPSFSYRSAIATSTRQSLLMRLKSSCWTVSSSCLCSKLPCASL